MKSLNTYNYHEQLYMKPFSYKVSISDDDKIVKIEEDGDLIAELSFALDNNTLFLNGKDGLEVAQIELPLSLAAITNLAYNSETKSIDLGVLNTKGDTIELSLDVAELVNVYTAGDGIDITDNIISIKIKDDTGTLSVDEEGLDIDLDSLASSEDITNINSELDQLQEETAKLKEYIDTSINGVNEKISNEFINISNRFEDVHDNLDNEKRDRIAADEALQEQIDGLQEQIGDVKGELEGSIADAIKTLNIAVADEMDDRIATDEALQEQIDGLQEQIGDVKGELEGNIADAITDLQEQIGDVKGELEGSIADAIKTLNSALTNEMDDRIATDEALQEQIDDLQEQIGDVKGELEGNIADAITDLQTQLNAEIERSTNEDARLEGLINNNLASINDLNDKVEALEGEGNDLEAKLNAEIERSTNEDARLEGLINTETINREYGDAFLQGQLGDGFLSMADGLGMTVTQAVADLRGQIETEKEERISGDNLAYSLISIEKEERISGDTILDTKIVTSRNELASSIKLVKDENNNLKYTLFVDGKVAGELNIPADKMLDSVVYDEEAKTLTFTWNTSVPQSPTIIDISDLIDVYLAGDGLLLNGNVFNLNLTQSKYLALNENGGVEFIGMFNKPEGTTWRYDLIGSNGLDNGKFIDFSSDFESFNNSIKEIYAPLTYVDAQDLAIKSELLGNESNSATDNTIYGLRKAIDNSENMLMAKIAEEQLRAEAIEANLDSKIDSTKADLAGYVNQEISKVNDTIDSFKEENASQHKEISDNVRANSDILASLTNGEQTGVVDKLDRQFHEITRGIDENKFEGLIKSLMDRINQLETTISILIGNSEVQGSVANMVSNCLNEAKLYAVEQDKVVVENVVAFANNTFQPKGNYITEIDGKYLTEDELATYNFVNENKLSQTVSEYIKTVDANDKFQVKGNYLTEIPQEYLTETELETKHYATISYVDQQDNKKLSRETADLLYQPKGEYVTPSVLTNEITNTKTYVDNNLKLKADILWVSDKFQVKGNYLTEIPHEYLTESELDAYNFATNSYINSEIASAKAYTDAKTADKLTRTEAIELYQPKGDYVTNVELNAKNYIDQEELDIALTDLTTKGRDYLQNHYQKIGNYLVQSDLNNYVTKDYLFSQQYVTLIDLNKVVLDKADKAYVDNNFVLKTTYDAHVTTAFTANNIIAGDNIVITTQNNTVTLNCRLSDKFYVDDKFNQSLPFKNDTLDTVAQKLSDAVKNLYDVTDGELF